MSSLRRNHEVEQQNVLSSYFASYAARFKVRPACRGLPSALSGCAPVDESVWRMTVIFGMASRREMRASKLCVCMPACRTPTPHPGPRASSTTRVDVGPSHHIFLSVYADYTQGAMPHTVPCSWQLREGPMGNGGHHAPWTGHARSPVTIFLTHLLLMRGAGSDQWNWLQNDLMSIDRTLTPW